MKIRRGMALWRWACVWLLTLQALPLNAQPQPELAAEPPPAQSADEQKRERMRQLFDAYDFEQALTILQELSERPAGPEPKDLYSLAQCHRNLQRPTTAFYYYVLAHHAYLSAEEPAASQAMVREEIVGHLQRLVRKLTVLTLDLGGDPVVGRTTLCDIEIDERRPIALPGTALQGLVDAGGELGEIAQRLAAGALLAGARVGPAVRHRECANPVDGVLELVVVGRVAHDVWLDRRVGNTRRPASFRIDARELQAGKPIRLRDRPAEVVVDAANLPLAWEQRFSWTLGSSQFVGARPQQVPAGSYVLASLSAPDHTGYVEIDGGERETEWEGWLLPAEQRVFKAEFREDESIVERWWFWPVVGALVVGGVTTAYVLTREDREPVDSGTLGWVVEVP